MDLLEDGGEELGLVLEVLVEGARVTPASAARSSTEVVAKLFDPNRAWPAASRAARVRRMCSSRNEGTPSCVAVACHVTHQSSVAECRYAT